MILLPPSEYARILPLLAVPDFNVIFARAVLERRVAGTVHVDRVEQPSAVHILHPYGLSLLCGRPRTEAFVPALIDYMLDRTGNRQRSEQMQVHPADWSAELRARLGLRLLHHSAPDFSPATLPQLGREKVIEFGRLNFQLDQAAYAMLKLPGLPPQLRVARAGREVFAPWTGAVIPRFFWDCAEAFVQGGVGFAVYEGERPLCVAFSAMRLDEAVEIGIETHPEFRGRGLATYACAALIRFCLDAGLEPVWSTRHDNVGSQALAARLGFRQTLHLPFYRLVMRGG